MKLRIKGNTIRFRLSKSEVSYFADSFHIEEKTEFGKNAFIYSLKTTEQNLAYATFEDNILTFFIPRSQANEWTTTENVGISGEMEIGNGKKLYLLLEKDFKCLDETSEDQSDNFENPIVLKNK